VKEKTQSLRSWKCWKATTTLLLVGSGRKINGIFSSFSKSLLVHKAVWQKRETAAGKNATVEKPVLVGSNI